MRKFELYHIGRKARQFVSVIFMARNYRSVNFAITNGKSCNQESLIFVQIIYKVTPLLSIGILVTLSRLFLKKFLRLLLIERLNYSEMFMGQNTRKNMELTV